jgi:peptide/nickel transport system permease protein
MTPQAEPRTLAFERLGALRLGRVLMRRGLQAVPVVFGILTLTFVLIHIAPGDPVVYMAGEGGTPEYYADMRARYGLDRALPAQYLAYLAGAVRGDLGYSFEYQLPVSTVIAGRLPATLLLTLTALALAIAGGIAGGIVAALVPGSLVDGALRVGTSVLAASPVFWTGQLLLLAFAVALPLFPVGGASSLRGATSAPWLDTIWHLALPATCLSLGFLALLTRVVRGGVFVELGRLYVTAARSRGASRSRTALRHALANALIPVVTLVGHQAGSLLTGAGLVEVVFGWPGLGRLLIDATSQRDYPLVIAMLLTVSTLVVVANFVTDLLYAAVDPRVG